MHTAEAVRKRLKYLCRDKGMAVNSLARRSGVHPSTVKSIMSGTSGNPGIITVKKLCDGLDIPLPEFFDDDVFWELPQEIR